MTGLVSSFFALERITCWFIWIRFFIGSVPFVGCWLSTFKDNNRHGQALLFSYLIFLDNNLGRKRTGQAQPPSPVPRNHRRDTQDLAWAICQKFGV
jgi:hypothetical protein